MNELSQTTFTVHTTPADFAAWFREYTLPVYLDFFPLEQGGYTLQPLRDLPPLSPPITLYLDAFYWDGDQPRSGSIHPRPRVLSCQLTTPLVNQTTVTLACHDQAVRRYYNDLLVAILLRWPETQSQLAHPENDLPPDSPALLDWSWLEDEADST